VLLELQAEGTGLVAAQPDLQVAGAVDAALEIGRPIDQSAPRFLLFTVLLIQVFSLLDLGWRCKG
jgi:hypothetical protein